MISRLNHRAVCAAAVLCLMGCPDAHRGASPRPTLNSGACWPEPASSAHSTADGCDPAAELDRGTEPNGQLTSAVELPGNTVGGPPFKGSLGSGDDVDVYVLPAFALPFTSSDPVSRAAQRPKLLFTGDSASRVCAFFSCATGVTSLADNPLDCSAGDGAPATDGGVGDVTPAHLEEGMLGCCRTGSGTLIAGIICDNTEPRVTGFVTVESVGEGACNAEYKVSVSLTP